MIHTVTVFGIVDATEVDNFLKFPSFLYDPANVGNLISGSSSFSKPSLDIRKFLVRIMLKPSMQKILSTTLLAWVLCLAAQLCLTLRPHGLQPARLLCSWGFSRQEHWSGLPCPPPGTSMGDECNCPMVSTFFGILIVFSYLEII